MLSGIDEALKNQIVEEDNLDLDKENKDKDDSNKEDNLPNDKGIGEEAELKIKELTEANEVSNKLIDQFGGSEKAKQWIEYLNTQEFKDLSSKKIDKSDDSDSLFKGEEQKEAINFVNKMILEKLSPLQSQMNSLSKQSVDRLGDVEEQLLSSRLDTALESLSTKFPDLDDYKEGIVKHAKELYPKGKFTFENIKSLYLLAKIDAGKLDDGSKKEDKPDLDDLSNIDIKSLTKDSKNKSFNEIAKSIMSG